MTYKFGTQETTVVGGLSAADALAGYRVLHTPDWRAAGTNGAALDNVAFGDQFNINSKVWSFTNSANKHIVCGDAASFMLLPDGTTHAKLQIAWGQRHGAPPVTAEKVVWRFGAIQSSNPSSSLVLDNGSGNVNDVKVDATASDEVAQNAYKIDGIELNLGTDAAWVDGRVSMFYLTRLTTDGNDNLSHAAHVYSIQVLVK